MAYLSERTLDDLARRPETITKWYMSERQAMQAAARYESEYVVQRAGKRLRLTPRKGDQ